MELRCVAARAAAVTFGGAVAVISAYASERAHGVRSAAYAALAAAYRAGFPPSGRSGWVAVAITRQAVRTCSSVRSGRTGRPSAANGFAAGVTRHPPGWG